MIFAWPWGEYLGAGGLERGVRISVSPWVKFSSRMMPTTAKACGQYLNSILAVREAADRGFDEALLLDENGNIAEGSGENIFLVKDGRLFTNDESSSILMGITRDSVLKIADDLGFSTEIGILTLDQLRSSDEAFFTGTAVEVTPIRELDGQVIGGGKRGPITEKIQQRFFEVTSGRRKSDYDWLHLINSAREPETVHNDGLGAVSQSASVDVRCFPQKSRPLPGFDRASNVALVFKRCSVGRRSAACGPGSRASSAKSCYPP